MENTSTPEYVPFSYALKHAIEILEKQEVIPKSPGSIVGGKINYCAAAAIVAAGSDILAKDEERNIDLLLKEGGSSADVVNLFELYGWNKNTGKRILQLNDSITEEERKKKILIFLSSLLKDE